jgi:hypothetical protein
MPIKTILLVVALALSSLSSAYAIVAPISAEQQDAEAGIIVTGTVTDVSFVQTPVAPPWHFGDPATLDPAYHREYGATVRVERVELGGAATASDSKPISTIVAHAYMNYNIGAGDYGTGELELLKAGQRFRVWLARDGRGYWHMQAPKGFTLLPAR